MRNLAISVFVLGQVLDAVLTYMGVSSGWHEGNPIVAWQIDAIGLLPALVIGKVVCISLVMTVREYRGFVAGIWIASILTFTVAILPWFYVLLVLGRP
jgi:hypothetical protein